MKMTNLFKVFQKVLLDINQDDEVLSPPCYLCLPSAGAGGRGRGWPWQWCREVDWCSARAPPAHSPGTRGPPPCSNMPAVNKENISKAVKISATSSHTSPAPRTWSRVRCGCWGRPRSSRPCWPRPRRRRWTCWPGTRTCSCSGVSPCPTVARKPRKIVGRLIDYSLAVLLYLATAGALVGAPVYVPVVLQAAGVLEQLAALVTGVPPAPTARVQRLAHTVWNIFMCLVKIFSNAGYDDGCTALSVRGLQFIFQPSKIKY